MVIRWIALLNSLGAPYLRALCCASLLILLANSAVGQMASTSAAASPQVPCSVVESRASIRVIVIGARDGGPSPCSTSEASNHSRRGASHSTF